jgi:hypothetical protein
MVISHRQIGLHLIQNKQAELMLHPSQEQRRLFQAAEQRQRYPFPQQLRQQADISHRRIGLRSTQKQKRQTFKFLRPLEHGQNHRGQNPLM